MDYQHNDVVKFWHAWISAIVKYPGRTLCLLSATVVLGAVLVVAVAFLAGVGAKLADTKQQVSVLTNQLAELKIDVRQYTSMKQEVSQTVNVITKVEKEIGDIKEAINAFYRLASGDIFRAKDKGRLVQCFTTNGLTFVYFELKHIPLPESVLITHRRGAYSPFTYSNTRNIVELRLVGDEALSLKDDEDFCFIRYHKDSFTKEIPLTVNGIVFRGEINNLGLATYKERSQQPVEGDSMKRNEHGAARGAPQP
jgi:hypothetical protein